MIAPKYTLDLSGEGHAPPYRERKPAAWSPFYHSNYLAQMNMVHVLTSYAVMVNQKIDVSFFGGTVTKSASRPITWDPTKTTVTSTSMIFSSTGAGSIAGAGVRVFLNGSMVIDGPTQNAQTVDISTLLRNGINLIDVLFWSGPFGGEVTVNCAIDVEYTGDPPYVPDGNGFPSWLPVAIAGVGMAMVGGVILLRKKGRKK